MSAKPKVIILSGGMGTRLSEETIIKPKPMVEVGGYPILWHIMKIYSHFDVNEFVLALGYKGEWIKKYFLNYYDLCHDFMVETKTGKIRAYDGFHEDWKVHLVDTGLETQTGGRIKRLKEVVGNNTFMMTYGDGVGDINIKELLEFHKSHGKLATMTAVRPESRFGGVSIEEGKVTHFVEKPQLGEGWINGGFFVLEPKVFDYIDNDDTYFERDPLVNLFKDGQLQAYQHSGFWQPMDTMRDNRNLNDLWDSGKAPWKLWD